MRSKLVARLLHTEPWWHLLLNCIEERAKRTSEKTGCARCIRMKRCVLPFSNTNRKMLPSSLWAGGHTSSEFYKKLPKLERVKTMRYICTRKGISPELDWVLKHKFWTNIASTNARTRWNSTLFWLANWIKTNPSQSFWNHKWSHFCNYR